MINDLTVSQKIWWICCCDSPNLTDKVWPCQWLHCFGPIVQHRKLAGDDEGRLNNELGALESNMPTLTAIKDLFITKLISKARTDGFRSVGLPNSKSHSFSLFITFFHFLSLCFTLMELKWKKQLFEIFSTASWTATAVSKRQLISCHTKWEKTTMMLLYGMQTQMVRVFSNQCSVIRHP